MVWYYPILYVVCMFLTTVYMEHNNKVLICLSNLLLCLWMWLLTCDVLGV